VSVRGSRGESGGMKKPTVGRDREGDATEKAENGMKACRVSIIMPTYNRASLIGRAIGSVLDQTFSDWELVIVDDCSTDDTESRVAAFGDPRIRYVRQKKNGGVSAARNAGILNASPSEFIAFIDDDDEWMAEKISEQIEVFDRGDPSLGAVGCGRIDHEGGQVETFLPKHRGWIFEDVLARRARGYSAPLLLVRRFPGMPDFLFDESFPCLEDAEYVLRIARQFKFDFVPKALIRVYRDDGGPHVWNPENSLKGYRLFLAKYEKEFD